MSDNDGGGGVDLDGLAARIATMLGRNKPTGDPDGDDYEDGGRRPNKVPYSRFQDKAREVKALREQLSELGTAFEDFKAQTATWQQGVQDSTAEELKRITGKHAEDLSLGFEGGIRDPLGRKAVRAAWDAQPKEGRGKSASEWWGGLLESRKAHATSGEGEAPAIPPTLAGYLPQLEAPKAPPANGGGRQQPRRTLTGPRRGETGDLGLSGLKDDAGIEDILGAIRRNMG